MREIEALADVTNVLKGTSNKIRVRAHQEALPPEYRDEAMAVTMVEIEVDGKVVLSEKIPWPTPRGEKGLALAMQMFAEAPATRHTRHQPLVTEFVRLCEGYEPVEVLWELPEND